MCILCLYFVLKNKKNEPFIVEHVGIVPFIFLFFSLFGTYETSYSFSVSFFSFVNFFCFVLFKNGFIKGLL